MIILWAKKVCANILRHGTHLEGKASRWRQGQAEEKQQCPDKLKCDQDKKIVAGFRREWESGGTEPPLAHTASSRCSQSFHPKPS
jgi:hypothetical protein